MSGTVAGKSSAEYAAPPREYHLEAEDEQGSVRPARANNSSASQLIILASAFTLSSAGGENSPRSIFDR
jgi:hypothetical protein